jgi:hypothetical protein
MSQEDDKDLLLVGEGLLTIALSTYTGSAE